MPQRFLKGRRLVGGLADGLTVLLLLSACSSFDSSPTDPPATAQGKTFTGPWAHEFAQAYEQSGSSFVRRILSDSQITDAELSEVTERYRKCLHASGITFDGQDDTGSTRFTFPLSMSADDANREANACGEKSGEDAVAGLFYEMRRNPRHLDENTIMAACLVKKKLVPRDYDAAQYAADAAGDAFTFSDTAEGQKGFQECVADPLAHTDQRD